MPAVQPASVCNPPHSQPAQSRSQKLLHPWEKEHPEIARAVQSIVYDLRLADLVTNDEEANLKFNAVHFLSKYSMKPHVLPVCFFAGKIQRALDEGSVDSLSGKVLLEAFHLFLALLAEVGLLDVEGDSLMRLKRLSLVNQPQNYYHNSVRAPAPALRLPDVWPCRDTAVAL